VHLKLCRIVGGSSWKSSTFVNIVATSLSIHPHSNLEYPPTSIFALESTYLCATTMANYLASIFGTEQDKASITNLPKALSITY
jgi:hypothetical protein